LIIILGGINQQDTPPCLICHTPEIIITRGIFDKTVHSKRLDSIANAALGVISSTSLIVHRIGIGLADLNGLMDKHAIKQVDRLLSNTKFNLESMFGSWVNFVIGQRTEIKAVMDWTEFKHDKQTTLMLSLITKHGRATPLLWETFSTTTLKNNRNNYEDRVLQKFKNILSDDVKVTILADRGFCDLKLFEFLIKELKFDYIIRFRGSFTVTNDKGFSKKAVDWVPKNGKIKTLRGAELTKYKYSVPTIVCVKEKDMKQEWCIACSDSETSGSEVVKWYAKRRGCEPQFRDTKDLHFGMGLSETHIKNKQRRDRLLFLAALSMSLLTMLGAAGEEIGLDRYLKANTVKHRTMSLFRQGCCYFRKLPKYSEDIVNNLMAEFNKILSQQAKITEILGVI